jgi:hypothetical protein
VNGWVPEEDIASMSSTYCAVAEPTKAFQDYIDGYKEVPKFSSYYEAATKIAATTDWTDPLANNTSVEAYYTPSTTGSAVWDVLGFAKPSQALSSALMWHASSVSGVGSSASGPVQPQGGITGAPMTSITQACNRAHRFRILHQVKQHRVRARQVVLGVGEGKERRQQECWASLASWPHCNIPTSSLLGNEISTTRSMKYTILPP